MNTINEATKQLIDAILESDIYMEYRTALDNVKKVPGLKEQIDEFRRRNYEIQSDNDYDLGKIDQLEKEYEEFRENVLVSDFLAAELAFCRMMQENNLKITEALHFE